MATSSYIPASENQLSLSGWQNGSVFDQIPPMLMSYPSMSTEILNLTILPNNLASLTFTVIQKAYLAFPLELVLFDPNTIQIQIFCSYPLSGQYDTLSRILFYVLMVVAFLFRRHTWIAVAALGAAMTYAAVSAVHLFAIIALYAGQALGLSASAAYSTQQYKDVDVWGIFPIIATSGIMLTPILMWSKSIRLYDDTENKPAEERRYKVQPVIIYWGLLIFAALVALIIYVLVLPGEFDILPSFASCSADPNCVSNQPADGIMTQNYYDTCSW